MNKDFDTWNEIKKEVERREPLYCHTREIWWCSLGINIGSEQDGQGPGCTRPVLIIRDINLDTFWGVPVTTQGREGIFRYKFNLGGCDQFAALS